MKCLQDQSKRVVGLQEALESEAFAGRVLSLSRWHRRDSPHSSNAVKAEVPNSATSIDELLERLGYPGGPASSSLSRVFDEYYYGPELLKQLHGLDPVVGCKRGLIDSEKIIVSAETLQLVVLTCAERYDRYCFGQVTIGTE